MRLAPEYAPTLNAIWQLRRHTEFCRRGGASLAALHPERAAKFSRSLSPATSSNPALIP
jgi:hypothetical protein